MVSSSAEKVEKAVVYGVKLSSVVPARVTGDEKKVHELTNMDLAMKLHYIRGLYFFNSDAVRGIDISDLKSPMFRWLELYCPTSGRIRRHRFSDQDNNGRPFINCNDGGVRIVEANCTKTLDEWLLALKEKDHSYSSPPPLNDHQLVYTQVLGPDLGFSPLVFVQFTWFKCGGLSVGLSWAHILGDAFSASTFMNMWGQIMAAGHVQPQPQPRPRPRPLNMPNSNTKKCQIPQYYYSSKSNSAAEKEKPFSLKMVDPVGDYWLPANNCKMESHSFHITARNLHHILSRTSSSCLNQAVESQPQSQSPSFQILAALMWKSLAKVRGESEPKIVTICSNINSPNRGNEISSNSQVIGVVEADFKVAEAELLELAKMIGEKMVDERSMIEELVERESGKSDFIVYGTNLTFVNLEEVNIYGLQLKGKKPVFANYTFAGIGDEGAVLVLPGPPENGKEGDGDGRTVTVIVPENQILELKNELRKEWGAGVF